MTKTALIVDEDLETLAEAAAIFNLLGYTVNSVSSSEEAIDRLSSWRYNVMLTDASLTKGMNGLELAKVVAKVCFQTKILVGTSDSVEYLKEHHGFEDDFILISKPYSSEVIAKHVAASTLPASITDIAREKVQPLTLAIRPDTLIDPVPAIEQSNKAESNQE